MRLVTLAGPAAMPPSMAASSVGGTKRAARVAAYIATRARSPSTWARRTGSASAGRSVQPSAPRAASARFVFGESTYRSTTGQPYSGTWAAAAIAAVRA